MCITKTLLFKTSRKTLLFKITVDDNWKVARRGVERTVAVENL